MAVDHKDFGTFCEICFRQLTYEQCAVDKDGQRWDVCAGDCGYQAGIEQLVPSMCECGISVRILWSMPICIDSRPELLVCGHRPARCGLRHRLSFEERAS